MTVQNGLDRGTKPVQISLRCFADNDRRLTYKESSHPNHNNSTVLVFSSQITQDQYQNLTVGTCGVWTNGKLERFCLFYDDALKQSHIEKIKLHAVKLTLPDDCAIDIMSRDEFVTKVFFSRVYSGRAKCVGFNLPFEISRLAIHHGKARNMQNGFSFKLSGHLYHPNIRIRSINSNASFVQFAAPIRKKSEKRRQNYRGYFLDLKTLNYSMTNESCEDVFEAMHVENKPQIKSNISLESIQHSIEKVMTTHQLYQKLIQQFTDVFLLPEEIANKMHSPASIAKKYVEKIGIKPFLQKNPDFPKEILGFVMSSYYGGRTEVRIRKKPVKVSYLDFTSMYPTMFVLMNMSQFLTSEKISFKHTREKTQELLNKITPEDVSYRKFWGKITTICKIRPDNDILPIRSNFGKGKTQNIRLNYLKSADETLLWYTLPDIIASKLLTGKTPIIEDAITFTPTGTQEFASDDVEILKNVTVNPAKDDFIKRLIEKRLEIKNNDDDSVVQNIVKIIANAASYGIHVQINSEKRQSDNIVHGLTTFECRSDKTEYPSVHFNPIIATFLTAGARLILAAAESLVLRNGGYLAYCDTDSVMISPKHVKLVQEFFSKLNPYHSKIEMFKVEKDENGISLHDVWFYGISSKRYVLYTKTKDDDFQIYKHSLHGLGHLINIDGKYWWENILQLHYNSNHPIVEYDGKYCMSKLVITTPQILDRLSHTRKIKPFDKMIIGTANRVDPDTGRHIIPTVSFLSDNRQNQAPFMPFVDYNSGKKYPDDSLESQFYWKPLSENFTDYANHSELKLSGDTCNLKRLKIKINQSSVNYIGKESNNLDESNTTGISSEPYTRYENIVEKILNIRPKDAWKIGISRSNLILLQNKVSQNKSMKLHHETRQKIINYVELILKFNSSKISLKKKVTIA